MIKIKNITKICIKIMKDVSIKKIYKNKSILFIFIILLWAFFIRVKL